MYEIFNKTKGEIIALDGKTIRAARSKGNKKGIHMVSAWACQNKLTLALASMKVAEGENEITTIKKILKLLNISKCTVTIDAIGCQKEIAKAIVDLDGLENICAKYQGELISSDKIIAVLTDFYQNQAISERFTAIDKELLYQSLIHFLPDLKQHNPQNLTKELADLDSVLEAIVDKITIKPIQQHTKTDLLNIQLILDKITEIKFILATLDQGAPINKAEEAIRSYLSANSVRPIPCKALGVFFSASPQSQQELEQSFVASKRFLSI